MAVSPCFCEFQWRQKHMPWLSNLPRNHTRWEHLPEVLQDKIIGLLSNRDRFRIREVNTTFYKSFLWNLREINLVEENGDWLNPVAILAMVRPRIFPNLVHLDILWPPDTTTAVFPTPREFPSLRVLSLNFDCTGLSTLVVVTPSNMQDFQHLTEIQLGDVSLTTMKDFKGLQKIYYRNSDPQYSLLLRRDLPDDLSQLHHLSWLGTHLDASDLRHDLSRLLDAPVLKALTFGRTREESQILAAMPELPSVEMLSGLNPPDRADVLVHLKKFPRLKYLNISTESGTLTQLPSLPTVKVFRGNQKCTGLTQFENLEQLLMFNLKGIMPALYALKKFDLRSSPIETVALITPERFPNLEDLNLYFIGTARNPFDIRILPPHPRLRKLAIPKNIVNSEWVTSTKRFPALTELTRSSLFSDIMRLTRCA